MPGLRYLFACLHTILNSLDIRNEDQFLDRIRDKMTPLIFNNIYIFPFILSIRFHYVLILTGNYQRTLKHTTQFSKKR